MGFWLSRDRLVTNVGVALALESETALAPTPVSPVTVNVTAASESESVSAVGVQLGSTGIDEPLPDIDLFESNMTTYGHDTFTGAGENDGDFSYYYDYGWGCRQISQWLGGSSTFDNWEEKALEAFMTDRFEQPDGSYPYRLWQGWWGFPHGLYNHWAEGGPKAAKCHEWLIGAAQQTSGAFNYPYPKGEIGESPGWPNKDSWAQQNYSREVAYWIQFHVWAERAGMTRRFHSTENEYWLARYINFAANHLKQWKNNDYTEPGDADGGWMQTFMVFLTLYALTEYVDLERDLGNDENQWWPTSSTGWQAVNYNWTLPEWNSISEAIVDMTYWLFDTALTQDGTNRRMWVEDDGSGYGSFRYVDRSVTGVGSPSPAPDLNLLMVPVFGWVGKETGDATLFTERGDKIFQGGVRNAFLDRAKIFNQNYIKSFAYIKFRENFGA